MNHGGERYFSKRGGRRSLYRISVSQLVSRFLFLRDQNHPFLRSVIDTILPHFSLILFFRLPRTSGDQLFEERTRKILLGYLRSVQFHMQFYLTLSVDAPGQDVLCRAKRMKAAMA